MPGGWLRRMLDRFRVLEHLDQPRQLVPHFNRDLHSMTDLLAFSEALTATNAA